ncbi:hypothetical protein [Brumicola pallidula]|uniref:Zinc-finger domain-containing protein n=1 Tax=Brumicola pallidula DSM 14239 = ACAM 615 TaxID=1121922 RepID=K6YTR2_9ALTE|nr:hypothetical protein [Glaciecola pallidula]GAC27316.1 hypothetical protein GPAL_0436 [Glaciecola pallidula DSM 14239 = ACAM 615]
MHLTDQQLNEADLLQVNFDAAKYIDYNFDASADNSHESAKYAQIKAHLVSCAICQSRLLNLQNFRQQLAQDTEVCMPSLQWQKIESEVDAENSKTQVLNLNQKVKRLQKAVLALAASVLIFLIYPNIFNNSTNELDLKIAAIISENNKLQTDFSKFIQTNYMQLVAHETTQFRLQQIDQEIQLAYLNQMSTEQKIELWDERKQLLIQSLNDVPKRRALTI